VRLETIMPTLGRVVASIVLLLVFTAPAIPDPAKPSTIPVKAKETAPLDRAPARSCVDMNGKSFSWSWPNVPFAAVCGDREHERVPQK
jgi:hypothetical protein